MAGLVILGNPRPSPPPATGLEVSSPPPRLRLFAGDPPLLFLVEGSRLFEVDPTFFEQLSAVDEQTCIEWLGIRAREFPSSARETSLFPPNAISLNVAHTCNLSCGYCYADEGRFGGRPLMMTKEVACAAVDRLLDENRGRRVTVGFIGGEPFLNREVIHATVAHARKQAQATGSVAAFSVTTNGTLLRPDDLALLRENCFAVSISLDGAAAVNDEVRRSRNGGSAFELAIQAVSPLLQDPGRARVAARATVTRRDMRVAEHVAALLDAGFHEVGVSPLRTSPLPDLALRDEDWPIFLNQMKLAADQQGRRWRTERVIRFSNLAIALKQLHAGYSKPLPCGSAASYVSVSARGEYFTCHRTVDNPRFALGDSAEGLSMNLRAEFLRARHVDRQQPCASCWARYLCGGGCHAEVLSSGRSGCDYIRGWLEHCIRFYDRALRECPEWFPGQGAMP